MKGMPFSSTGLNTAHLRVCPHGLDWGVDGGGEQNPVESTCLVGGETFLYQRFQADLLKLRNEPTDLDRFGPV